MKITKVTPWLLHARAAYYFGRPGEYIFVEVKTDEGITGWGEVTTTHPVANRAVCAILRELGPMIEGDDPIQIEKIWNKIFRRFTYMGSRGASTNAISGIDIALWDIRGKALNQPIYNLLGGAVRDSIELYTHPDPNIGPDEARKQGKEIADSGHKALKFDPYPSMAEEQNGYLSGKMDARGEAEGNEITAAFREGAGPDMELLIDAHGRFDVPTAVRLSRSVSSSNIHWWEEPVPVESTHALKNVRAQIELPISVGERLHTRWEFVAVLEQDLTDFLMPDVTWTGGISELKKISTMAEAYYVPISPHDASGPINVLAGAHVMMSVPNFYKLETARHRLDAYDVFIETPIDVREGSLHVPDAPGLGIEINMDFLRANADENYRGD
ncbi:MAG TPA: mandelate racemase/muconate lactonizing enzyme family protein [Dehalococcoidia bacterium]|jgi:galactonate dehydratase|nr:mandelate racemase [Chloroflexota bacterium]MEE2842835.1 mandelate racemase/muconate lactonizing enzyme family protein [Chloroflexota bacterium]HAG55827.1 mandelate racemase [Dehalococcoidia bacterium]HIM58977.1 mandelate racemase/muconate lactonizing enzyme family protein [Dehalococcoidia bacterium]|tara:strand:+ start:326 stop:1480 length:1155 start_codon:yes stop_codon:yes gene_type:complete